MYGGAGLSLIRVGVSSLGGQEDEDDKVCWWIRHPGGMERGGGWQDYCVFLSSLSSSSVSAVFLKTIQYKATISIAATIVPITEMAKTTNLRLSSVGGHRYSPSKSFSACNEHLVESDVMIMVRVLLKKRKKGVTKKGWRGEKRRGSHCVWDEGREVQPYGHASVKDRWRKSSIVVGIRIRIVVIAAIAAANVGDRGLGVGIRTSVHGLVDSVPRVVSLVEELDSGNVEREFDDGSIPATDDFDDFDGVKLDIANDVVVFADGGLGDVALLVRGFSVGTETVGDFLAFAIKVANAAGNPAFDIGLAKVFREVASGSRGFLLSEGKHAFAILFGWLIPHLGFGAKDRALDNLIGRDIDALGFEFFDDFGVVHVALEVSAVLDVCKPPFNTVEHFVGNGNIRGLVLVAVVFHFEAFLHLRGQQNDILEELLHELNKGFIFGDLFLEDIGVELFECRGGPDMERDDVLIAGMRHRILLAQSTLSGVLCGQRDALRLTWAKLNLELLVFVFHVAEKESLSVGFRWNDINRDFLVKVLEQFFGSECDVVRTHGGGLEKK